MGTAQISQQTLQNFTPAKSFFIGIDSDGCVFDSMELKQKECFTHNTVRFFHLQPVYQYARETSEFVNLYSKWRGANRFPSLIRVMDFLAARPEVKALGFEVPRLDSLRTWMTVETRLGNPALKAYVEKTGDPELKRVLEWSLEINRDIEKIAVGVGPFLPVMDFLKQAGRSADLLVVSQTPAEALDREWRDNAWTATSASLPARNTAPRPSSSPTRPAAVPRRPHADDRRRDGRPESRPRSRRALLPDQPGDEENSWQRLLAEGLDRFLKESFAGDYESALIAEFEALLPEKPNW